MQTIQKDCYMCHNKKKKSVTEMKSQKDKNLAETSTDSFQSQSKVIV